MKVSVAVVTYNRGQIISRCLDSLEDQIIKPYEVIVVDSSEDDDTEKIVRRKGFVYQHSEKRIYQPQARNIVLEKAKGDIVAFVDDDVICTPQWLENVIYGFSFENVVGVGGPVIRCDESLRVLEKAKMSDKNQNFFTCYGDFHFVPAWISPKPVKTKLMMGCNMSFLKEKLREVKGFDEFYGRDASYREETDPQIALIKKGYDFMYMPKAIVYHLQHRTGGIRSNNRKNYYYWCAKNHKYLVDKYFPKWLSRLSWIFWSYDPPCLWVCILSALIHRNVNILKWVEGLWT